MKTLLIYLSCILSLNAADIKNIQNKPLLKFDSKKSIIDVFENWVNCDKSQWLENKGSVVFKCIEIPEKNYSNTIVKNLGDTLSNEKQSDIDFYVREKQQMQKDLLILEHKIKSINSAIINTNNQKNTLEQKQRVIDENRKQQKKNNPALKNNQTTENIAIKEMENDFKKWDKKLEQENIRQEKDIYQSKIKDFVDKNQGDKADIKSQQELIEQIKKEIIRTDEKIKKISSKNNAIAKTTDIKEVQQLFEFVLENNQVRLKSIRSVIFWNDGKKVIYFNKLSFARYAYKNKKLYYRNVSNKRKSKSAYRFFKKMKKRNN
jgi:hypothetical protein